jgi:hypothetical protein
MSASVPDACEVLPGKSPRFDYHTREKRNRAHLRMALAHFDYAPGRGLCERRVAAAGDQPHHIQVHDSKT